ncbi:hypothetical protein C0991_003518 [Blastosporella zonata]|nr:hypothetical protein C0991_003518 [Blastosporella zonata]
MFIRRAALPVSAETDVTPSANLALLPLLSISVIVLILIFFIVRIFRRSLYFSSFSWLRGKGRGTKGRLGLSGVELLPTSFKAIPTPNPSPYGAAFKLEGNAGKEGSSGLLSRSSSLDALPQLSMSSPSPYLTSRRHSYSRPPFSLPTFLKTKHKPLHRRSRSLGVLNRNTSSSMPASAPCTPSPKTLLIDFSTSNSSSTSTSASSDLGTHKLRSTSPLLIPGLAIPTSSPEKARLLPQMGTHVWTFDIKDEGGDIADSRVTDPLLAAFKRTHPQVPSKSQQESMVLIQYEESSSPPPPTAPLVPNRLSAANPFSSLADSFSSQAGPLSPSPLAFSPSRHGTELMPIKVSAVQSTANLVDFSDDELDSNQGSKSTSITDAPPTAKRLSVDSLLISQHVPTPASTHKMHAETEIDPTEPLEAVSDPFDDSHAITFSNEEWTSDPAPTAEQTRSPLVDFTLHARPLDVTPPSPIAASPVLRSLRVEPEEAEDLHQAPELLTASWEWDGSSSPSTAPVAQTSSGWPLAEDEIPDAENDLMSFDNAEVDHEKSLRRSGPTVELGIEVHQEIDPADAWFIEEPTAVWDASWTGESVKGGALFETDPVEDMQDDEFDLERARPIDVLDELRGGPGEPIDVHVFEEMATDPIYEAPEDSTTTSNDIHDFIISDQFMTPAIIAATPLLSTPATPNTPNTPLPELPTPSPAPISLSPVLVEYPDPDLLPLPDLTLSIVVPLPLSPVPVKGYLPAVHQAQTPTPPASPPPALNVPTRPLWSLRASDAPPLGLPATINTVSVPDVHVSEEETQLPVPVASEAHQVVSVETGEDNTVADNVTDDLEEVIALAIDAPSDESLTKHEQPLTRPTTPHLGTLDSLPGSFPVSPSPFPVALPNDTIAPSTSSADSSPSKSATRYRAVVVPSTTRLRTPRSAIDIALAMQLRPGLGAGADPAWMVRFLMAMFGWFAILVSGDL